MWSKELAILLVHTSVLVARTFISIYVARLEGTMVKFIVQKDIRWDRRSWDINICKQISELTLGAKLF